jgi:OOP family OmpA-OmpF porin
LRGVNFDFNRAEIRPDAGVILDEAARLLNQEPEARVRIEGHTDWIGSEEYNQTLSERRAEAVTRHLVEQGVAAERLTTVGYGETRPIASNEARDGRALNRRVELKVLGQ